MARSFRAHVFLQCMAHFERRCRMLHNALLACGNQPLNAKASHQQQEADDEVHAHFYGSESAWDALTEADVDQLAKAHADVKGELTQSGEMVAACELEVEDAQVVTSNSDAIAVTDGPFTEGQQVITGYYIIDCVDTARAAEIASKFAEVRFTPIEVRRLGKGSTWTELQLQR